MNKSLGTVPAWHRKKPDVLYRKIGRKYQPVGYEFTGFPANGIWIVENGRMSLMTKVGEVPEVPTLAQLKLMETAACRALSECLGKTMSLVEVWDHVSKTISREEFDRKQLAWREGRLP